jgi:type I restriction enzyme S subunit
MAKKKELTPEEKIQQALVPKEEQPYPLPEGWKWVRLGDITKIVGGGTPSSSVKEYYEDGNIAWISPSDLSNYSEKYISYGAKNITKLGLEKSSAQLMPKGTVLLSSRAPIGYVAIAKIALSTNQGFKNFLPSPSYLPDYLYWYLKGNTEILKRYASGTTFLELSAKKAALIKFPLAPIEEQKRIVQTIEKYFCRLDKIQEILKSILCDSGKRKSAILHKAFTGELTVKWREENKIQLDSWEEHPLSDIARISSGGTPSRKVLEYYQGDIPWIKTGEIYWNYIFDSEEHISEDALNSSSAKCYLPGTVLVAMYGQGLTRGRAAILNVKAATNQAVCALQPFDNVKSKFLYYYFMNNYWRYRGLAVGGNQPNYSATMISRWRIKVPTLKEQEKIVCIIDQLFDKEKQFCNSANSVLKIIELLRQSILINAFHGSLIMDK